MTAPLQVRRIARAVIPTSLVLLAALPVSVSGGAPKPSSAYGGPYYIGGGTEAILASKADQKAAQFAEMNQRGWDSSVVAEVKTGSRLFIRSIRWNRDSSNAPDANRFQQYNYVVQDRRIFVAVWDPTGQRGICNAGVAPFAGMTIKRGVMDNTYPETTTTPPGDAAPCILADGTNAILDDSSKHYMLAHGPGTRISSYDPGTWTNTTVGYAGEILVTVGAKRCSYTINQNSGTYVPHAGTPSRPFKYLDAVARLFATKIGTYPSYEINKSTGLEKPGASGRRVTIQC